jgi:hypothetical protein
MPKKNEKPPCLQVIVTVSGGVADLPYKSEHVAVTVLDYDVEGSDANTPGVSRDSDSHLCCIREWGPSEEAVGAEHWPTIKKAREARYCRAWKCPGCGRTVECSYEDLAEAGAPFCMDCDAEMTLL